MAIKEDIALFFVSPKFCNQLIPILGRLHSALVDFPSLDREQDFETEDLLIVCGEFSLDLVVSVFEEAGNTDARDGQRRGR